jgi:hypothetical protein
MIAVDDRNPWGGTFTKNERLASHVDGRSRDERDLYYYHLSRHMRVTHGQEIAPGTPNRRRLTQELHDEIHDDGAGHDRTWGLE